jgi:hypothetical protein
MRSAKVRPSKMTLYAEAKASLTATPSNFLAEIQSDKGIWFEENVD